MQPSRGLLQMDDEFKLKKDHLPKRSSPISDPPKTRSPCTGRPWSLGRDNSTAPGRSSADRWIHVVLNAWLPRCHLIVHPAKLDEDGMADDESRGSVSRKGWPQPEFREANSV
ncbi:hypothetical protein CSPX01_00461 [Colletotrichum filicis]|nr:hypothetical protein CSPX01_00461 [Colletotrichum filicis]